MVQVGMFCCITFASAPYVLGYYSIESVNLNCNSKVGTSNFST